MKIQYLSYINKLTNTAEEDYKASKLLFEGELYAQSIYFLQQSVEKIVKSYSMISESFTPEDIRKEIGHQTPRAFVTPLVKWWSNVIDTLEILEETEPNHPLIKYINLSQPIFPEIEEFVQDYSKYKEEIKEIFAEIGEKIVKIDETNIKKILSGNLESRFFLHGWLDNEEELTKDVDIVLSSEHQIVPEKISDEKKKKLIELMRERRRFFLNLMNMFTLAVLTYPHVIYSRYPNEILSPNEYNYDLGIVKCYKKLSRLLKETITWFREDLEEIRY